MLLSDVQHPKRYQNLGLWAFPTFSPFHMPPSRAWYTLSQSPTPARLPHQNLCRLVENIGLSTASQIYRRYRVRRFTRGLINWSLASWEDSENSDGKWRARLEIIIQSLPFYTGRCENCGRLFTSSSYLEQHVKRCRRSVREELLKYSLCGEESANPRHGTWELMLPPVETSAHCAGRLLDMEEISPRTCVSTRARNHSSARNVAKRLVDLVLSPGTYAHTRARGHSNARNVTRRLIDLTILPGTSVQLPTRPGEN